MGLITIKENYFGGYCLQIPNYSIRTVFWEYLGRMVRESSPDMTIDTEQLKEAIVLLENNNDFKNITLTTKYKSLTQSF